ncbi:hypothetical protein MTP03_08660 [Tsukamurella sp. PLM1]|nr:hypothetical protein MTP03_08660 [Tsukamurella sp. PLM1]
MPAGIDVGDYSVEPYVPKQGDGDFGWAAEGNRMVEAVVLPSDVDPSLTRAVKDVDGAPTLNGYESQSLHDGVRLISGTKVGVSVGRADLAENATKEVRIGLYRYTDAEAVSKEMKLFESAFSTKPKVTLPSASDAAAAEHVPGEVDAFVPVGALLVHVHAKGRSLQESTSLADRILAVQIPAAKQYRPTAGADVPRLPLDRDGILSRAVGMAAESDEDRRFIAALTPPMYERRLADNPIVPHLREAGVDLMGWNYGKVMRARDVAAATRLFERLEQTSKQPPGAAPPGLDGKIACRRSAGGTDFVCRMHVGRYYAQVGSRDLTDAQQLATAQWVLLTRSP